MWVRNNPARFVLLAQALWPLKFGTAFVEGGDLNRYIYGDMTRSDANRKIWFYITDPVTVYEVWFERYGRDDPIVERRDQIANKFIVMLQELQAKLGEADDLQARVNEAVAPTGDDALSPEGRERLTQLKDDIKAFRAEMSSPEELYERVPVWKEFFGDEAALVAAQILYAFHREKRPINPMESISCTRCTYHTRIFGGVIRLSATCS
jgi:hypothetical protein